MPTNVEDAHRAKTELLNDIDSISSQLADRNKTDENGRRVSYADYHSWRARALHSQRASEAHLREVSVFIKRYRTESKEALANSELDLNSDEGLLFSSMKVLKDIAKRNKGIDDESARVIEALERRFGLR